MKKFINLCLSFAIGSLLLTSCNKNEETSDPSIIGTWSSTENSYRYYYYFDQTDTLLHEQLTFREDNTVQVIITAIEDTMVEHYTVQGDSLIWENTIYQILTLNDNELIIENMSEMEPVPPKDDDLRVLTHQEFERVK